MNDRNRRLSRRHFLLAAGAGSAATAAALVARSPAAPSGKGGTGKRATQRYAETDHIRDYYRTAKV